MDADRHQRFWDDVGSHFPSLKGAPSTAYYFECERALFDQFFPDLAGRSLFKTDLWDEAKNSEILRWAAANGAQPVGIDISTDVVQESAALLAGYHPRFAIADIRAVPFRADCFDFVYSMGTIEHFPETELAVAEIFRVLKPGGRAIIGVPNKLDPFLRPTLVTLLNAFGLYAYGMEKSYTTGALQRMLEVAGYRIVGRSGILFMPGWLRMLDLLCSTRWPSLARVTDWMVRPFAWLYRRVPALRRHGYLIALVAEKPSLG